MILRVIYYIILLLFSYNQCFAAIGYFSGVIDGRFRALFLIVFLTYAAYTEYCLQFILPKFLLQGKFFLYFIFSLVPMIGIRTLHCHLDNMLVADFDFLVSISLKNSIPNIVLSSVAMVPSSLFPAILVIIDKFAYMRRKTEDVKKSDPAKEIAAYKDNVTPQLILDTLDCIKILSRTGRKDDASQILLKLSNVLRYELYDCRREFSTPASEYKFLIQYLELAKICDPEFEYCIWCDNSSSPVTIEPKTMFSSVNEFYKRKRLNRGKCLNIIISAQAPKYVTCYYDKFE